MTELIRSVILELYSELAVKFLVTAGRTEKEIKTSVINWQLENDQKETVKQLRTERLDIFALK